MKKENKNLCDHWAVVDGPLGPMTCGVGPGGVGVLSFGEAEIESRRSPLHDAVESQLAEYARGSRTSFDLPLAPLGTDWQRRVWDALLAVPYGVTTSYGALARTLGSPNAARAVGLANGANPIAIVVPCHRVVAADGSLHGYAGGLPRKRSLLEIEGVVEPVLFG